MNAARLCWSAAALILVTGMCWGIVMSATNDHTTAPAHAHFNLTGWVTLALYGTYYALNPAAGTSRIAMIQSLIALVGSVVFAIGIAWVVSGGPHEPAVIGALIVFAAAALFVYIVLSKPLRRAVA